MRLERLKIKNFLGLEDIDLDFTNKSIFVIWGKNGAGKSSIFEAIYYTLFGENLRNLNNQDVIKIGKSKSILELEFKHKDKKYYIKRELKRTKKGATAGKILIINDKEKITRTDEFNKKIKEALGFDKNLFKFIIYLPQNQITHFINEKGAERIKTISILFKLEILDNIKELLKKDIHKIDQKIEDKLIELKNNDIEQLANNIKELEIKISQYKKDIDTKNKEKQEKELTLKQVQEYNEKLTNLNQLQQDKLKIDEELAQLKDKLKDEKLIEQSKRLYIDFLILKQEKEKYLENKNNLDKTKLEIDKQISQANNTYHNIHLYIKTINKLIKKLYNLSIDINIYENTIQYNETNRKITKLKEKENILKQELKSLQKEGITTKDKYNKLNNIYIYKKNKYDNLNTQKKHIMLQIEKENEKINTIQQSMQNLLKERKTLIEKINPLEKLFNELNKQIQEETYKNYVIKIKSKLKVGDICPVCLNEIKHLKKDENITNLKDKEEQFKDLSENLKKLQNKLLSIDNKLQYLNESKREAIKNLNDLQLNVKKLNKEIEDIKNNVNINLEKLSYSIIENLNKTLENLRETYKNKNNEYIQIINKLEIENEKLKEVKKYKYLKDKNISQEQLNQLKKEKDLLVIDISKFSKNLSNNKVILNNILSNISNLYKNYKNLKTKEENLKNYKEKEKQLLNSLEKLNLTKELILKFKDINLSDIKEKYNILLGKQNNINEQIADLKTYIENNKNLSNLSIKELTNDIDDLQKDIQYLNKQLVLSNKDIINIKDRIDKLKQLKEEIKSLEKKYNNIKFLYNLILTKNFPNYLTTYYLKGIIDNANIFLEKLTNSKYKLIVLENGNIVILDEVNQIQRQLKSLSGGEQVLVSIAFALGLSSFMDIETQTLLIDEGFSSLDDTNLQIVADSLMALKDTGKLIGLITHNVDFANLIEDKITIKEGKIE